MEPMAHKTYFVIVPSISETTTEAVSSHRKILAVQAASPEAERENVMVFIPGFRLSCFYVWITA